MFSPFSMFFFLFLLFSTLNSILNSDYENCSFIPPHHGMDPNMLYPIHGNDSYLVVELDPSTDAKCLDGTNVKLNFSRGIGSGQNKFLFFFLGGAFCGIDDATDYRSSCLNRSLGYLGSNKFMPPNNTVMIITEPEGYFSNSEFYNPKFWNWNKIGINYCDGSNHQGYLKDPILVNGTELWFRGYNNTKAAFEWARKKLGLFEAEEIIIAGESAGAQAVYMWSSYLQDYFPKNIKFYAIPEAGFFLDIYNVYSRCNLFGYYIQQQALITNSGQTDLFRRCPFYKTKDDWKCLIPQYIVDTIDIPLFIINSQNDYESLNTHMGIRCVTNGSATCLDYDKKLIHEYRQQFLLQILNIKKKHPRWGFWLRSCIDHIYWKNYGWYSDEMKVFNAETNESKILMDALHSWYEGLKEEKNKYNTFIDLPSWEGYCP